MPFLPRPEFFLITLAPRTGAPLCTSGNCASVVDFSAWAHRSAQTTYCAPGPERKQRPHHFAVSSVRAGKPSVDLPADSRTISDVGQLLYHSACRSVHRQDRRFRSGSLRGTPGRSLRRRRDRRLHGAGSEKRRSLRNQLRPVFSWSDAQAGSRKMLGTIRKLYEIPVDFVFFALVYLCDLVPSSGI